MKVRNLNVLDINDQNTEEFISGAEHFNVQQIATWREVQAVIAGKKQFLPPDLLLLDVSFDKDDSVKGASIDDAGKIVPIGPILALPFLNMKEVMGFAPYSAHIDNNLLLKFPPFLVAIGLIASKIENEVFGSTHLSKRETDNSLDDFLKRLKRKRAGNPNQALNIALELYRENFLKAIKNDRLLLINSQHLTNTVSNLQDEIEPNSEVEFPSDLGLELLDAQNTPDCISVISLFADQFSWSGRWATEDALDEIYDWIKKATESETPFAKAIRAIEEQDKIEDLKDQRPRIDHIIAEMFPLSREEERREIFRLCILFANVHSLSLHKGQKYVKKEIFDRLGVGVEQNIYLSWFGKRNRSAIPTTNSLPILNISPLSPINNSLDVTEIDCCFLSNGTVLNEADDFLIASYRRRYSDPDKPNSDYFERWVHPYSVR